MRDFTVLESMVREEESREYLHEAVAALSNGANRAALVTIWTAVTLDIMRKIRHLSEGGDSDALRLVRDIDRTIDMRDVRHMQNIEFNLLKNALEMEIISARQKEELDRIRRDRDLCAHPGFVSKGEVFNPSVELVRAHIATAVDSCLALPAITGGQKIQLFERDLCSSVWPDLSDVPSFVRRRYLVDVRERTRCSIAELAVDYAMTPTGANEGTAAVGAKEVARRCRCFVNSLAMFDENLLNTSIQRVLNRRRRSSSLDNASLLRSLGALGYLNAYWVNLREDELIGLDTLLRNSTIEELIDLEVFSSGIPANTRIAASCEMAFAKIAAQTSDGIDRVLAGATYGRKTLVPLLIDDLNLSNAYRIAEHRLSRLSNLAAYLGPDEIKEIGRVIRANDQIYYASGTQTLLLNIFEATKTVPGAKEAWVELASGLNSDYITRYPDNPDGYYSYSELLSKVEQA